MTNLITRLEDRAVSYDQSGPSASHTADLLREAAMALRNARKTAIQEVLDLLTAHELYRYRPKAFNGFIEYASQTLLVDQDANRTEASVADLSKHFKPA